MKIPEVVICKICGKPITTLTHYFSYKDYFKKNPEVKCKC